MEILAFLQALLRRWWLVAACAALGVAVALLWSASAANRFQSFVTLQLNPAARSAFLPFGSDGAAQSPVSTLAASYAEVLRSRAFGELVVQQLNLAVAPEEVAQATSARLIPNTNIMRLTVTWDNPQDAQALAQSIAEIFIMENLRRQQAQPGGQSRLAEMEETARGYAGRIDALRQQRDRLDQAVTRGDLSRITELNSLDSRLTALESSYANLLVEINRARSELNTASILDTASPATPAGTPGRAQLVLFGLVGGVCVAIALAMLLNDMDDTLRTPEDVATALGAAPLATIGRIGTRAWSEAARPTRLAVLHAPRSAGAEAFRTLRTNLRFTASERPFRSLVVTSPGPHEGKTFVASNLALALAKAGERVLLMDADLRRPELHALFGLPEAPGLAEALAGAATSEGAPPTPAALPTGIENLWLLPAGRPTHNPSDLLAPAALEEVLRPAAQAYDVVILDTAPVGPVSDTLVLAAHADAALIVARAGQTRQGALGAARDALTQTGRPVLGTVLNDFRLGPLDRYGRYGRYASYDGRYYGDEAGTEDRRDGRAAGAPAAPRPGDRAP